MNKTQIEIRGEVFNKVFCSSCFKVVGYTQDESHDINLVCEGCLNGAK